MLKSFYEQLNLISDLSVLTGFNANIDRIKHLTKEEIERIIKTLDKNKIKEFLNKDIETINSKEEFIASLLKSMKVGEPKEIPLTNNSLEKWFDGFIGIDYEQIGGQAAIVADLLSRIGIKKVIFYTNPILKDIVNKMYSKNIFYPVLENDKIKLYKIDKIASSSTKLKINRIFEYYRKTRVNLEEMVIEAKNSTRLIVASRPEEYRIGFDEKLSKHIDELGKKIDGFFVSGFQSIKRKYSDGLDFQYYISKNRNDLIKIKKHNKKLRIHLEMASVPNVSMRKGIIDAIFPVVDYIGMDSSELNDIFSVLFGKKIDENDIEDVITNLSDLIRIFDLKGVQLHTFNYILLITKEKNLDDTDLKNSLNFGSILASTKAALGKIDSKSDLIVGFRIPFIKKGLSIQKEFYKFKERYEFSMEIIPTRMVFNPKATVGLGDTLSAGIFVSLLSSLKMNSKN